MREGVVHPIPGKAAVGNLPGQDALVHPGQDVWRTDALVVEGWVAPRVDVVLVVADLLGEQIEQDGIVTLEGDGRAPAGGVALLPERGLDGNLVVRGGGSSGGGFSGRSDEVRNAGRCGRRGSSVVGGHFHEVVESHALVVVAVVTVVFAII